MSFISDKINRKAFWIISSILLVIFIASMIVFTFFDYQATAAVYNPDSFFGHLFKVIGTAPPWIVLAGLFSCMFYRVKSKKNKVVATICMVIANIISVIFLLTYYTRDPLLYVLIIPPAAALLTLVFFWIFKLVPKKILDILFYVFLIVSVFYLMETALVQLLKVFVGRVRFVDLDTLLSNYTLWFIPNGINGHESFPSGHTSSAAAIWVLILCCFVFNFKNWQKACLYFVAVSFAVCTALSRMVLGAHYATDVIFSLFTSFVMYAVAVVIVDKILKRRQQSQITNLPLTIEEKSKPTDTAA
jgi:membrane-associated phospholipid phosphatase